MPYAQINNLDYSQIKENLKNYLKSQSEFTDYDFEGSALSNILDVLAYNTYYTAFNTNLIANEFFIDSATLRDNVVKIAKQLGYRPRSKVASRSKINFTSTIVSPIQPSTYTLKKGTGFITNYDNSLYNFVVVDDVTVPVEEGTAVFTEVDIFEGNLVTEYFVYNKTKIDNRIVLSNPQVDVSSIRINVYDSQSSSVKNIFNVAENILDVDPSTNIFFIEEVGDEKYEIIFGDGVFGRQLEDGNYIEISYLVTNGSATNGVENFRFNGLLVDGSNQSYQNNVVIDNVLTPAYGGAEIETADNIKFIAPKYFGTQNRAVTAEDFKPIISKIYPNVSDIITYGGEDEQPPEYGVVKIIIKPKQGEKITSVTKNQIEESLKPYMVASVRPRIIDPSVLYIEISSNIYYSKLKTNLTRDQIKTEVINSISDYIDKSDTEKFSGKLRYSKINSAIDKADGAIESNETSFTMRKDVFPILNSKTFYEVCYQNSFDKDCDGATVYTTGFVVSEYPNYNVYLKDVNGKMVLYRIGNDGNDYIVNSDVGNVNYLSGEIKLYNLTIIKGSYPNNKIEFRVVPLKRDIFAFREQYLKVDIEKSTFIAKAE